MLDNVHGPGAERDVHICGVRGGGSTLRIAAVSRTDDKNHTFRKVLINTGETCLSLHHIQRLLISLFSLCLIYIIYQHRKYT
jgi:uncharacterized membrane protein